MEIQPQSQSKYVENKSTFLGFLFRILDPAQIKVIKQQVKTQHASAAHITYGGRIGGIVGYSDDREPPHTAGTQILSEIDRAELDCVVVFVVRYFGGKKLGKKNLALAYRECAKNTINALLEAKNGNNN